MRGFLNFIREQGVVGLAVGFILGGAVSKVVAGLVSYIINPMLGLILGGKEGLMAAKFHIGSAEIFYGGFLSVLIDFIVIALVVYFGVKIFKLDKLDKKKTFKCMSNVPNFFSRVKKIKNPFQGKIKGVIETIRPIDVTNEEDIQRYAIIDRDPKTLQMMVGSPLITAEIKKIIASHGRDRLLYAVADKKNLLRGWVQFVAEEPERLRRLKKEKMLDPSESAIFLEISYAKYSPPEQQPKENIKGRMTRTVARICDWLCHQALKSVKNSPNILISAYTDPINLASENLLKATGFSLKGKIAYKKGDKLDNFWVYNLRNNKKVYERI